MFWMMIGGVIIALIGGLLAITAVAMVVGLILFAVIFLFVYGVWAALIDDVLQYWLSNSDTALLYSLLIALPVSGYTFYLYNKYSDQPPKQ